MSIIRLPIDVKSLYFNIKNDNETGHTPTVATPLKQGASIHEELARIVEIPENIDSHDREELISKIQSKSRVQAKINNIFVFDRIAVNGILLEGVPSFCMYIREETDPKNVHYGRQKVHYPISLVFEDTNIHNKNVLKAISDYLCNYAFLVEAFEYDQENQVLNFDITIVGEENIPYSKVFINRRGVGNKFTSYFSEVSDVYDLEIIALRERHGYDAVAPDNFNDVTNENILIARSIVVDYLKEHNAKHVRVLKEEYPYSLYDIQYSVDGKRKYAIIKQTATKSKYFNLSLSRIQFCNDFADFVKVFLVTDVNGVPQICTYDISEMNKLDKTINSITYKDRN